MKNVITGTGKGFVISKKEVHDKLRKEFDFLKDTQINLRLCDNVKTILEIRWDIDKITKLKIGKLVEPVPQKKTIILSEDEVKKLFGIDKDFFAINEIFVKKNNYYSVNWNESEDPNIYYFFETKDERYWKDINFIGEMEIEEK